jgi:hypothetical protein
MQKNYKCVLCNGLYNGYGNNPAPIKILGKCCNGCNKIVIKRRINDYQKMVESVNEASVGEARMD